MNKNVPGFDGKGAASDADEGSLDRVVGPGSILGTGIVGHRRCRQTSLPVRTQRTSPLRIPRGLLAEEAHRDRDLVRGAMFS